MTSLARGVIYTCVPASISVTFLRLHDLLFLGVGYVGLNVHVYSYAYVRQAMKRHKSSVHKRPLAS